MPGETGEPRGDDTRVVLFFPTRGCGCIEHPAFPTPLFLLGERFMHHSGVGTSRECGGVCELRGGIATSDSDEAIHTLFAAVRWIAWLALAMTILTDRIGGLHPSSAKRAEGGWPKTSRVGAFNDSDACCDLRCARPPPSASRHPPHKWGRDQKERSESAAIQLSCSLFQAWIASRTATDIC
jgi:hypothetical protein